MRFEIGLLCLAVFVAGCANSKSPANLSAPPPIKTQPQPTYITPDLRTVGRVELVNTQGRFVVLSFPPGRVPPPGQHWRITHLGLQIGEVTISGPQREVDTVADIVDGTANVGDEATAE
jgi:hypothetical protein